jgi:hypothetical protein
MTGKTSSEREKRLAEALRKNLARRKQQARAKKAPETIHGEIDSKDTRS